MKIVWTPNLIVQELTAAQRARIVAAAGGRADIVEARDAERQRAELVDADVPTAARAAVCAVHAALDDAPVPGAGSPQEPDQSRAVSAPGRAPGPEARRRWGLSGGPGDPLHGAA